LWGGDIRQFHPPFGVFSGVIGGPPCQGFSIANRHKSNGSLEYSLEMLAEFERVVQEASPQWFLLENVRFIPTVTIADYIVSRFALNARWIGMKQSRLRHFQFGSRFQSAYLDFGESVVLLESLEKDSCVTATEGGRGVRNNFRAGYERRRPWERVCELQGMPPDFLKDAPFTVKGKYIALGNGVPLPMGRALAKAIKARILTERSEGQNEHWH